MKVSLLVLFSTCAAAQLFEMSAAISSGDLVDILNMANELMVGIEAQSRAAPPSNPCEQDMARLKCDSAKCLVAKAAQLSPPCARLVIAPSPSPDPARPTSSHTNEYVEIFEMAMPDVEVTLMSTDGGKAFDPSDIFRDLSPEFAHILDLIMPGAAPAPQSFSPPQASVGSHPCAVEVEQCVRETGTKERRAIERCLLAHYEDLSATCKCFVHEMDDSPEAMAAIKQRMPPAAAAPAVLTVPGVFDQHEPPPPRHEPMRHISCMLFMPLMVVAIALLVRRCCLCCCQQKPIFAAVVPPEKASINTVQPLLCVPIAPPLKHEELVKVPAKA
jgi:hypothetical protein